MTSLWSRVLRRSHFGTEADRATFRTLHTASLASPALREGLTTDQRRAQHPAPARAARHPRGGADRHRHGCWPGTAPATTTRRRRPPLAVAVAEQGRTRVFAPRELPCDQPGLPVPLRDRVARWSSRTGSSARCWSSPPPRPPVWSAPPTRSPSGSRVSSTLAELDASRTRLMEAEVRALRAQISPHFIYNSLGAIASFVRTDPDRARELLLEFADFTRYSFRRHGEYTTLAEELRSIERYLLLEQARFGDRLQVTLRIAPEVLPVAVPFLCIQPLVENAVRHGLEGRPDGRPDHHRSPQRPRPGVRDRDRGRRRRRGPRAGTPRARRRRVDRLGRPRATSTSGCAAPSATTTVWSSRPRPAPAPR